MAYFAKRIVTECRRATRSFQVREGFVELGHFNKYFIKNPSKKLHNYTTTFWMENLTWKWSQSGFFFLQNQSKLFNFQKRAVEIFPPPHLFACQYLWIFLNILENACIVFWLCQGSEYAWSSYMSGLALTNYCIWRLHAVSFLRNEMPFYQPKIPKTHVV